MDGTDVPPKKRMERMSPERWNGLADVATEDAPGGMDLLGSA